MPGAAPTGDTTTASSAAGVTTAEAGADATVGTTSTTSGTVTGDSQTPPDLPDVCGAPPRVDLGPPPAGCQHRFLINDRGHSTERPSGFIRCADFNEYRIAEVQCPFRVGDECTCDAHCDPGMICACAGSPFDYGWGNRCAPALCKSSDECGDGYCKVGPDACGSAGLLACTTPGDDCLSSDDCERGQCAYAEVEEFFTCSPGAICE